MSIEEYIEKLRNQLFFGNEKAQGSVRWRIKWYRDRACRHKLWFRWAGGITLFISISLPFLVGLTDDNIVKATIATYLSWFLAVLGGASGFFQWNKNWQSYTEAHMGLEKLLMDWELLVSKSLGDDTKLGEVQKAAEDFVLGANKIVIDETKSYFEEVKFPNMNVNKATPLSRP